MLKEKNQLLLSTLLFYMGSYMLPIQSLLGIMLVNMTDSSLVYNLGIALYVLSLYLFGIRTTYAINYSSKSLKTIIVTDLDIYRYLSICLLLGLYIYYTTEFKIIGFILFVVGLGSMSILISSLDNFRIKVYNLYTDSTNLIKKDIFYIQIAMLFSAFIALLVSKFEVPELTKHMFFICWYLFFIWLSRMTSPNITRKTTRDLISYPQYLRHLKNNYLNYNEKFKYYIKSNIYGNVGSVILLQILFIWHQKSDVTLFQIASIYFITRILSYLVSKVTHNITFSPFLAIKLFRILMIFRIILILLLPRNLISLFILYAIGSTTTVFLMIGKKDINTYVRDENLEPEEASTIMKATQGLVVAPIAILSGLLQSLSIYGLIIFAIFEILVNIVSIHYLEKSKMLSII